MLVKGKKIPVKIYHEWRNNVRAAIGKNAVILRFPILLSENQKASQLDWFKTWVADQFEKNEKYGYPDKYRKGRVGQ